MVCYILTTEQHLEIKHILSDSESGLIVVGELTHPMERKALKEILKESDWPVIIDASSGLSQLRMSQIKSWHLKMCYVLLLRHSFQMPLSTSGTDYAQKDTNTGSKH